jgi:phytoene dehydrogenase-like protein
MPMTDYDAIIIGAGHNGLICASYLAKAGKNVLVVDARNQPGGCASTREFAPGCHVSDCAQWLSQLDQSIVKDLDLKAAGLKLGKPKQRSHCNPTATTLFSMATPLAVLASIRQIRRRIVTSKKWCAASPS